MGDAGGGEPDRTEAPRRPRRAFRFHALAFVAVAALLWVIDRQTPGGPWFHWPVAAWALLLGGHYLYLKSRSVDQTWAEERARELRYKSYDLGHMQDIRESQRSGRWAGGGPTEGDDNG